MNTHHHYLRLLRTLALAALTAAAVAACSDDNGDPSGREPITPPDDANPGIPVSFTADINPGSDADPDGAPGTRTVLTPDGNGGFTVTWKAMNDYPNNGDLLYIWAVKGNTPENNGIPKYYVPTTSAASSELVPFEESDKFTLSSEGNWTFAAIYGHRGAGGFGLSAATVSPLTQSAPNNTEHIAAADFSVATDTKTVAANSDMPTIVNFKFKHMLSAMQLRITNQTGEALTVREIRLSAAGGQITSYKKYNVVTGGWSADGEQKSDYLKLEITTPAELASGGTAQDFHMLLFPGYAGTDMTITVITDRGEYTLTKTAPASPGFEAGTNYMTNIAIKSTNLTDKETWTETISTAEELKAFRDNVNNGNTYDGKTVRLLANIDLTNETWTPIGNSSNKFQGTFDGGGYHISKLSVDYGSENYAGLFGYIYKGTVRNLRVSGTVKTTGLYAGGIAGTLSYSTVENCIFNGDVSGGGNVGGIAGWSKTNSRIAGCHTKGKVTTTGIFTQRAGGIAGLNEGSTIDGCYSEAEVTTSGESAGGIAGSNYDGGTVTHCYATGKVSSKNNVGGIVGYQYNSSVTGCIALNPGLTRTAGNKTYFGRVVGYNDGSTPTSCAAYEGMTFTDANGSFDGTGEAGTALTHEQCVTASAYTSRGFAAATATTPGWAFDTAATWTYLPWNPAFWSFPGITATETDSYRIRVPQHLSGGTN